MLVAPCYNYSIVGPPKPYSNHEAPYSKIKPYYTSIIDPFKGPFKWTLF